MISPASIRGCGHYSPTSVTAGWEMLLVGSVPDKIPWLPYVDSFKRQPSDEKLCPICIQDPDSNLY